MPAFSLFSLGVVRACGDTLTALHRHLVRVPIMTLSVVAGMLAAGDISAAPLTYYVAPPDPVGAPKAPSGLKQGTVPGTGPLGSEFAPFPTLEAARDAIRVATGRTTAGGAPPSNWEGATVILMAGTHARVATFLLDGRDSGTEAHPIVYRAEPGTAAKLSGAYQVRDSAWSLVTAADTFAWARLPVATRAATYKLNVSALGINTGDVGGGQSDVQELLMLIRDGELKRMSRYPAASTALTASGFLEITGMTDSGNGNTATGVVDDLTVGNWTETSQDILMVGITSKAFAWGIENVTSVAPNAGGTLVTVSSRRNTYAWGVDGISHYVAFVNALQAITEGTCVWNRTNGMMYYLPAGAEGAPTNTSLTLLPTMLQLGVDEQPAQAVEYLRFEGLTFEGTRAIGVSAYYARGVVFDTCVFRNMGGFAVGFEDALASGFDTCEFYDLGRGAAQIHGQGKATLTDSGCFLTDSHVHDTGFHERNQSWALSLGEFLQQSYQSGCGVTISGNTFEDLDGGSIGLGSARLTIANNIFRRTMRYYGDSGDIYGGRSFTNRYITIGPGNTFTDIVQHPLVEVGQGIYVVYLDDAMRGVDVIGNTFTNCTTAMQLGGGADHNILRNKFTGCSNNTHQRAAIRLASRIGRNDLHTAITTDLLSVALDAAPWSTDWPALINYRVGGSLYNWRLYPSNALNTSTVTIADNMITEVGEYLTSVAPGPGNNNPITPYYDFTDLNYPAGSSGTPVQGGGTVPLSTVNLVLY